jgi:uncharacterized membrane protein
VGHGSAGSRSRTSWGAHSCAGCATWPAGARRLLVVALLALSAAGLAGVWAGPAAAKSFSITEVAVDATVRPNGDVKVHESRTLGFSGSFHYVYWDYRAKGSDGISVIGASGPTDSSGAPSPYTLSTAAVAGVAGTPGTYSVEDTATGVRVQLSFDLSDASATFGVDYIALGAARRWQDTAELYWQFVGAGTAVPSDHVRITVHLPQGVQKSEVRAWTHGPLWGNVVIEPDASVVSTVSPLPAYTFIESRILFPASALTQAKQRPAAKLGAVLAEEKALADKANRERWLARAKVAFWLIVGIGIPLVALVLVIVLYVRFGRELRPRFNAPYLRDLPEPPLPPALVGFIWRMGSVGREDATATLLDLINRGVIDIERVEWQEQHLLGGSSGKVSYKLTLHEEKLDELLPYEHHLVNFLFTEIAGGWSLVIADLRDLAKAKRTEFASGYKEFTDMVGDEGTKRDYLDAKADRMAFTGAAFGFIAAVAAGVAGVFGRVYWMLLGLPVWIGLIFMSRSIKRRSAEAAELYAQYQALRRYMKDFGRMQEKPPDSVVLWQQFLVYAVVFDMADEVIKAMQVKVPEVMQDPAFRTMTFMMIAQPGMGPSPFSAIDQSFGQAVAVATSSSSSGSGGGGGFSGGGGGGGGGGGFGAG